MIENIKMEIIRVPVRDVDGEDMQQGLWSKLPTELVANIITQTTHPPTQDAWCLATQHVRQLHGTAMRVRWHSVTIHDRDLVPAPGDDSIRFNQIREIMKKLNLCRDWSPAGSVLKMLLVKDDLGCCPANYVCHITFDFRMLGYWTNEVQGIEDYDRDSTPSLESAEYTLDQLKEHLYRLDHVTCYGDVPQKLLNFVGRYATGTRELELREYESNGALYISLRDEPDRITDPYYRARLKIQSLSNLQQLTYLSIHQFSYSEAEGLVATLPKIITLQYLKLVCRRTEHDLWNGCAFEYLFSTFPTKQNKPIWLPLGLKHLSMADPYSAPRNQRLLVQSQYLAFPDGLQYLDIDLARQSLVTHILGCINLSSLKSLALPEHYVRYCKTFSRPEFDDVVQQAGNRPESIKILGAWTFFFTRSENLPSFQGAYTVEDLVLGTHHCSHYAGSPLRFGQLEPILSLSDYVLGFFHSDADSMISKWDKTLKRIRIDDIDIVPDLDVAGLSQRFWQVVKILMLQPALQDSTSTGQHDANLVDREICDELAQRIVSCGPRSLCVVVISKQRYWISRDANTTRHSLWTWAAAKRDSLQSSLMASVLDESDMDFLENTDVPYWHQRDCREWYQNLASVANTGRNRSMSGMMHKWNYLTMHRVRETLT